jgi:uncharacterized protein (DUF924 family)
MPEHLAYLAKLATPAARQTNTPQAAADVVAYWIEAGPADWFAQRPAFDADFRDRFIALHEAAARGAHDDWLDTPDGALALLILLDQFPRNAFRGTPRMYATDDHARTIARAAILAGHDRKQPHDLRKFFYLPFAHSEAIEDQQRSVALCRKLGGHDAKQSQRHHDIIARFGRFPHRNPILGRTMRPEEQAYLDAGGYKG